MFIPPPLAGARTSLRWAAPPEIRRQLVTGVGAAITLPGVLVPLAAAQHGASLLSCLVVFAIAPVGLLSVVLAQRRPVLAAALQALSLLIIASLIGSQPDGVRMLYRPFWLLAPFWVLYIGGRRPGLLTAAASAVLWTSTLAARSADLPAFLGPLPPHETLPWQLGGYSAMLCAATVIFLLERHGRRQDSEHVALLADLGERDALSRAILEHSGDAIVATDRGLHILAMNEAFEELWEFLHGTRPQLGQDLRAFAPEAKRRSWERNWEQVLQGEHLERLESHTDGERVIAMEVRQSPLMVRGDVRGLVAFGRDVTSREKAREREARWNREMLDLSRKAGMADLATALLHNIGNVLTSMRVSLEAAGEDGKTQRLGGLLQLAEKLGDEGVDRELAQRYLTTLHGALEASRKRMEARLVLLLEDADHLAAIVSSQQAEAKLGGVVEAVDVAQVVDTVLDAHALSLRRRGITLGRDLQPAFALVDRHRVAQIVANLVTNARDAVEAEPSSKRRIDVAVRSCVGGQIAVEVRDDGVGVEASQHDRIFTHGYTTKPTGHGFGLHMSALAAQQMHGELAFTSPGQGLGCTFTLSLPMAEGDQAVNL